MRQSTTCRIRMATVLRHHRFPFRLTVLDRLPRCCKKYRGHINRSGTPVPFGGGPVGPASTRCFLPHQCCQSSIATSSSAALVLDSRKAGRFPKAARIFESSLRRSFLIYRGFGSVEQIKKPHPSTKSLCYHVSFIYEVTLWVLSILFRNTVMYQVLCQAREEGTPGVE